MVPSGKGDFSQTISVIQIKGYGVAHIFLLVNINRHHHAVFMVKVFALIEDGDLVRERNYRRIAFELFSFGVIQQGIDVFVRSDHIIKANDCLFVP